MVKRYDKFLDEALADSWPTYVDASDYDALAARLAEAERERDQMREAILWACGERGEFPDEPPPLAGKYRQRYYWRTELRERAFGAPDSAEAAPDLFNAMGLPAAEPPAWERPMRQCHHGYFGDCPRCASEPQTEVQK